MKTILLLFISISCFAQQEVYPDHLNISSCWYNELGRIDENNPTSLTRCYFSSSKYAGSVELIIQSKEPILSPIFIFTNLGQYSIAVNKREVKKALKGVYYQSTVNMNYSNQYLWTSLDSGIKYIQFYTGKKWYNLIINDNLTKLKNYGK